MTPRRARFPRGVESIEREGVKITRRRPTAGALASVAVGAAFVTALVAIWTGDGRWWQTAALTLLVAVVLASAVEGARRSREVGTVINARIPDDFDPEDAAGSVLRHLPRDPEGPS